MLQDLFVLWSLFFVESKTKKCEMKTRHLSYTLERGADCTSKGEKKSSDFPCLREENLRRNKCVKSFLVFFHAAIKHIVATNSGR